MASFSCPHLDVATDRCLLLKGDCLPGRAGCVLRGTSRFAVPADRRRAPRGRPPPKRRRGSRALSH